MAEPIVRILSDLHYGDRASTLNALAALHPLFDGADRIILNGDTLDTRPGPARSATEALRGHVVDFVRQAARPFTLLTGNHDPDLSPEHAVQLAGGAVLVTHGDILFDNIVPWSRDAALARQLVAEEVAALPVGQRTTLEPCLGAWRRAAYRIPQRHQSERRGLKYFCSYVADTVWPPSRLYRILRVWQTTPRHVDALLHRFGLRPRFVAMGHTHRLGYSRTRGGVIVLNTGSFSMPGSAGAIDVTANDLTFRRIDRRRAEYRLSDVIARFPLAARSSTATLRA